MLNIDQIKTSLDRIYNHPETVNSTKIGHIEDKTKTNSAVITFKYNITWNLSKEDVLTFLPEKIKFVPILASKFDVEPGNETLLVQRINDYLTDDKNMGVLKAGENVLGYDSRLTKYSTVNLLGACLTIQPIIREGDTCKMIHKKEAISVDSLLKQTQSSNILNSTYTKESGNDVKGDLLEATPVDITGERVHIRFRSMNHQSFGSTSLHVDDTFMCDKIKFISNVEKVPINLTVEMHFEGTLFRKYSSINPSYLLPLFSKKKATSNLVSTRFSKGVKRNKVINKFFSQFSDKLNKLFKQNGKRVSAYRLRRLIKVNPSAYLEFGYHFSNLLKQGNVITERTHNQTTIFEHHKGDLETQHQSIIK